MIDFFAKLRNGGSILFITDYDPKEHTVTAICLKSKLLTRKPYKIADLIATNQEEIKSNLQQKAYYASEVHTQYKAIRRQSSNPSLYTPAKKVKQRRIVKSTKSSTRPMTIH